MRTPTAPSTPSFHARAASLAVLLAIAAPASAAVPAFPEAVGFGRNATGGRDGKVLFVTKLTDDGSEGTFRWACNQTGKRHILFRVGGTITLRSGILLTSGDVTIAGQSAPGGGICLRADHTSDGDYNALFDVACDNVIVRGLRFRAGPGPAAYVGNSKQGQQDSANILKGSDIIFDQCSFTWGWDETLSIWGWHGGTPHAITVMRSIIAEGLRRYDDGTHGMPQGWLRSMGSVFGPAEATADGGPAYDLTFHRNLYANNSGRNPLVQTGVLQWTNNVVHNWMYFGTDCAQNAKVNIVNNLMRAGPDSRTERYEILASGSARLFVQGNLGPHRTTLAAPEWSIVGWGGGTGSAYCTTPAPTTYQSAAFPAPAIPDLVPATELLATILSPQAVGACYRLDDLGNRVGTLDAADAHILDDVRNGTGRMVREDQFGFYPGNPPATITWPELAAGTPVVDGDSDGMPDAWEMARGLDPRVDDHNGYDHGQGYTNLEEYLNGSWPAPVNRVPVAQPMSLKAQGGHRRQFTLKGTDADGDALTYRITRLPTGALVGLNGTTLSAAGGGVYVLNGGTTLGYTGDVEVGGRDSFAFTVSDRTTTSRAATVSLDVLVAVGWDSRDIGSVGRFGWCSRDLATDTYTVVGSGSDIWNQADAFQFTSQTISGDFTLTGRVASMTAPHPWAKAGVMIRESDAAGSRHAFCCVTPANGVNFQRRTTTGGSSATTVGPRVAAPAWLRLVRQGSLVTAYESADGRTWVLVGSATIGLAATVQAGLAVTSHANANTCTAVFDQVTVVPGGGG